MALILLRHTTPDVAPGTCYGRTDLDVADTFEDEARTAAAALPVFGKIVSSPLRRCRRLAAFVGAEAGLEVASDPRLIEMDFGSWEGRPWADIPRAELDAWAGDFMHARPHGGESVAMLHARTLKALADHRSQDGPALLVTHSGVIKAALATEETAAGFATNIDFGHFVTV
ncbi:MAG: alpha-ribazole phosphatase family protein [Pseudomonadota bacterium]